MTPTNLRNQLLSGALGLGCLTAAFALEPADVDRAIAAAREYHVGAPGEGFRGVQQTVQATQPGDPLRLNLEKQLLNLVTSDADVEARRLACRTLWVIGGDASVAPLLKLAADPARCDMACYALRNHPSLEINSGLVASLPELSGNARIAVINLLGDRRAGQAVAALRDFITAGDNLLAEATLAGLGRIGTPAAARALLGRWSAAGQEASSTLLNAALQCAQRVETSRPRLAGRIYERMLRQTGNPRLRAAGLLGRVRIGGPNALTLVSEALGDEDLHFATTALAQVPTLPGHDVTPVFVRRLETLPVARQAGLLRALTARDERSLLPIAVKYAVTEDEALAVAAIEALGRLGDASVAPLLIGVVSGKADPRRTAAVAALRGLPGNGVNAALVSATLPDDPAAAAALVGVIADRGAADAVPVLLKCVDSREGIVAAAMFHALGRLAAAGDLREVASRLAQADPGEGLAAATDCLRQVALKHPDAAEASGILLSQYAVTRAAPARLALLEVLASLADPRGLAGVTAALYDSESEVQDTAMRLLGDWPDAGAQPTLMAIARAEGETREGILALRGVLRLLAESEPADGEDLLPAYRQALSLTRRDEERRLALAGLGATGLPGALDLVLPFLQHPALRVEAASAVLAIARQRTGADGASLWQALECVRAAEVPPAVRDEATKLARQMGSGRED